MSGKTLSRSPDSAKAQHGSTQQASENSNVALNVQAPRLELADSLRDSLGYSIKRAQVRCDLAFAKHLANELTPARFAALATIGANPGISQTALGALLSIAGPSVVKVVDELQRLKLVYRQQSSDRRIYALQLTKKGADDLKRYEAKARACEKELTDQLTPRERVQLITLLTKVSN